MLQFFCLLPSLARLDVVLLPNKTTARLRLLSGVKRSHFFRRPLISSSSDGSLDVMKHSRRLPAVRSLLPLGGWSSLLLLFYALEKLLASNSSWSGRPPREASLHFASQNVRPRPGRRRFQRNRVAKKSSSLSIPGRHRSWRTARNSNSRAKD